MFIINHNKIFFFIATVFVTVALVGIFVKGFNRGVDFTGGSLVEISFPESVPTFEQVQATVKIAQSDAVIQQTGDRGFIIRTSELSQDQKNTFLQNISSLGTFTETRFNTVGPSVGKELRTKALVSVVLVSLAIVLFIAFAFRSVVEPISSWKYGIIAIVVLVHDVVIPAGYFAWTGTQVDTLFIVGLLTILGVSINDTIVVFDRIRENLKTHHKKQAMPFRELVGRSITETMTRSIMTTVTVLVALIALVLFGPETTKNLALTMFIGIFFGTYSSVFLAAPLLVVWSEYQDRKALKSTK